MLQTAAAASELDIAICKGTFAGPISGADETLVAYATELHQAGYRVTVLLLYPFSDRDIYYRRLVEAGVPVTTILPRATLFRLLQQLRALATHFLFLFVLLSRFPGHVRIIWQAILSGVSGLYYERCRAYFATNRFDVLHVITPGGGTPVIIRAAAGAGLPVIYQELGTPHHQPGLGASYERLAKVTPLCASVAALSPRLARQWRQKLPHPAGLGVLPLAITPPRTWPFPRRPFPFTVTFGFAARMEAAKGPTVLIEAFAELSRRFEGAYLRLAGVGPQSYRARAQARSLGLAESCEFVGHYSDVDGRSVFMQTIDVFVLPSFAEGTPNSIAEAMAAGIPVIASGVGGIPDMLTEAEGILVPPGEPAALANAMLRLARDAALRARMGEAARARYERLFSPEAVLPVLTRTYREVARSASAAGRAEPAAPDGGIVHPWAERLEDRR
jgi:glycosyltransferase involved in cell wall biosynthesis